MAATVNGMEGIVAAQSAITSVNGIEGSLRYRGYSVGELAERCTFEEVAFLLWEGYLPSGDQLQSLRTELRQMRTDRADLLERLETIPRSAHPLDVLRHVVSWDSLRHPQCWSNDPAANLRKSKQFAAWFPVIVANYQRVRHGLFPISPRPDLDTAANYLYMLHGQTAGSNEVCTLDVSLVLHADHELNASTFAARVTIATQSNLHAAVVSALGTLAGPRHGGASDRIIRMLEDIGSVDEVENWAAAQLAARERVMGFGHRVYRTTDPRSIHLREMAERLLEGTARHGWIAILDRLTAVMVRERNLYPNVDLFAAVVNHALGIDPALYTSIFACSRIAGWTAHSVEQLNGRLIRPVAEYVGPEPRTMVINVAP